MRHALALSRRLALALAAIAVLVAWGTFDAQTPNPPCAEALKRLAALHATLHADLVADRWRGQWNFPARREKFAVGLGYAIAVEDLRSICAGER